MAKEICQLESQGVMFEVSTLGNLIAHIPSKSSLIDQIKQAQSSDEQILRWIQEAKENDQNGFMVGSDGVLRFKNRLCIPDDSSLKNLILQEAHGAAYTMHPGSTKMYHDLKQFYWWPGMKRNVAEYVSECPVCQQVKAEHQKPAGLLQPLEIPDWKWERITMDFVVGLPRTVKGYDSIWVIVDRLTKSAHFLPVKTTYSTYQYAKLYVDQIVRLHGVPVSIVSDRGPQFTSHFWEAFQRALGTRVLLSTAFHPQTDGQSERVIQVLEDLLRCCVLDFRGSWDQHLPLIEFAYNNSYQSSIQMAPFEALYGRKCRSPIGWFEMGDHLLLGPDLVQETVEKVKIIQQRLATAQSRQKSYADVHRRGLQFSVGDMVYLKISPMRGTMRFGRKGKLSPRYIGPYEILEKVGHVAYRLDLPTELAHVHPVFHVSMLRKHRGEVPRVIPVQEVQLDAQLKYEEVPVAILDRRIKRLRNKEISLVKVLWRNHSTEEATWEVEEEMQSRHPSLFTSQ